jgi:dephospho-CoA kinase
MEVLHVVGLVGAGKTTAIRRFFPTFVEIDVQDVYRQHYFNPDDIKTP